MDVNLTLPGEKFLIRFTELCAQAIGGVAAPSQIKRIARAQAEATRHTTLLDAQTARELEQIRDGTARLVNGQVEVFPPLHDNITETKKRSVALIEVAAAADAADAARRILNTSSILEKTKAAAADTADTDVSDSPVDPDWFSRWRLSAREVSDDEMQQVWAKVLAGEIKQPGSYSLRTLNFISQMSKQEAAFIEEMAQFAFEGIVYRADSKAAYPHIRFNELLRLEELGLIVGGSAGNDVHIQVTSMRPDVFSAHFLCRSHVLIFEGENPNSFIKVSAAKLTTTFNELLSVIRAPNNLEHFRGLGKDLARQGFTVKIAETKQVSSRHFWNDHNAETLSP